QHQIQIQSVTVLYNLSLDREASDGEQRKCSRVAAIEVLISSCFLSVMTTISSTEKPSMVCKMNTSRSAREVPSKANWIRVTISSEYAMSSGVAVRRSAITVSSVKVSSG